MQVLDRVLSTAVLLYNCNQYRGGFRGGAARTPLPFAENFFYVKLLKNPSI